MSFTYLLFSTICKASSDKHFALIYFLFFGMVFVPTSGTMLQTSIHSSSGTLGAALNMPTNLENSAMATGLEKVSFHSNPKEFGAMPKNIQTTIQLHSFHLLTTKGSKSFKLGFNSTRTENFQMFKLDLEKAEESEIKLPTSNGSLKKQKSSRKTSTSASLTMLKPLTVWITTKCGKFLKRWKYQTTLPVF